MLEVLWLIPIIPLAGFLVLAVAGSGLSQRGVAMIGAGSVGVSAVLASVVALSFIASPPPGRAYSQTLWTWMEIAGLKPEIAFYLDPLALVMVTVITVVGFLIHLYALEYMRGDEGYRRFFASMNLFVASMLILVLADNLPLLYLGWEGVGLCSYLLIGFWYRDPANGYAARKAFIVTRVGDVALIMGIFFLYTHLGTIEIQELLRLAVQQWPAGSLMATAAALLLLGGAAGKSAQLPLQTWLPDAMAGPTPVSALIHAATMVTAGVYLLARMNPLFNLAPAAQLAVASIGAATLLLAGCSALVQRDLKRVLAYSTMSQVGYMFLALGTGAWTAAIFHFLVHAFFKALLFLCAGAIMLAPHQERDIFQMGGLRKQLPLVFWTFLIGAASLSALPYVTGGFYSKEAILLQVWQSPLGGPWLWTAALAGTFLTSLYTFRAVFLVFFGPVKEKASAKPSPYLAWPLIILAILAMGCGFLATPGTRGGSSFFEGFLTAASPAPDADFHSAVLPQLITSLFSLGGILGAYLFFLARPRLGDSLARSRAGGFLNRFWFAGWGFDGLYNFIFVKPVLWFALTNSRDFTDLFFRGIERASAWSHVALSRTQSGQVRWYAAVLAFGTVVMVALAVFL